MARKARLGGRVGWDAHSHHVETAVNKGWNETGCFSLQGVGHGFQGIARHCACMFLIGVWPGMGTWAQNRICHRDCAICSRGIDFVYLYRGRVPVRRWLISYHGACRQRETLRAMAPGRLRTREKRRTDCCSQLWPGVAEMSVIDVRNLGREAIKSFSISDDINLPRWRQPLKSGM